MEDNSYSALRSSLSSTLAKTLSDPCREVLAKLDFQQTLPSQKGYSRNYRGLAGLMGFTHDELRRFEMYADITKKILESWETRPDATLGKLFGYLEDMDREDIIQELLPLLKREIAEYRERPVQVNEVTSGTMILHSSRSFLTRDDIMNGRRTLYDAYLSYSDDDSNIVFEFVQKLESPTFGLKLFIPERDMLAGHLQLDTDIEMIMNRCRHMLMVLTPNFIGNPTLEFQVSFAASLAIERNERTLIPIILESCEIPPILSKVSKIDFSKKSTQQWMWRKLVLSIRRRRDVSSSPLGSCPLRNMNAISNSACCTSDEVD